MYNFIKRLELINKIVLSLSIIILMVLVFKGDFISDEISSYYRFDMEKVFHGDITPLILVMKHGDHSPVYFLLRAIAFKITGGLIFFRLLSVFLFLCTFILLRQIILEKFNNKILFLFFDILLLLNPFLLYEVAISSKYIFMSFFLIYALYDNLINKKKKKIKQVLSLIMAVFTHYFSLFFITFYFLIRRDRKHKKIIIIFLLIISFSIFLNLNNIFQKNVFVRGESEYISSSFSKITNAYSIKYFFATIGKILSRPQIYGTDTSQINIDIFSGIFVLFVFIYYGLKRNAVAITMLGFIFSFYILSLYYLKSNNIIFFEANRLTNLIFPLVYLLILIIKENKFKYCVLTILIFLYIHGFFIIYSQFPDEISKINDIISKNPAKLYSYSPEYKGKYDEANLLKIAYKRKFYILDDTIDENKAYLFTNNNFKYYINKNGFENFFKYNIKRVFEGRKYSLYYIKR
ncbi:MAG: hypothetical protein C0601_12230 [Candidatus Muiribacterium halophilum]|uniref:Uncharacterized protein n=1 Tax=Muiribacterium halophilum TaxID=2053465 RepID=A0A2N5ZAP4_MUIH1|nr:MAG: hypothetical protein C0601_12230 [Candidatus Muirbacterium halophilum]